MANKNNQYHWSDTVFQRGRMSINPPASRTPPGVVLRNMQDYCLSGLNGEVTRRKKYH